MQATEQEKIDTFGATVEAYRSRPEEDAYDAAVRRERAKLNHIDCTRYTDAVNRYRLAIGIEPTQQERSRSLGAPPPERTLEEPGRAGYPIAFAAHRVLDWLRAWRRRTR